MCLPVWQFDAVGSEENAIYPFTSIVTDFTDVAFICSADGAIPRRRAALREQHQDQEQETLQEISFHRDRLSGHHMDEPPDM